MRLVIIPVDSKVSIDGVVKIMDLSTFGLDPNIHAVQWFGDHGWIEKNIGDMEIIDSTEQFSDLIEAHQQE